MINCSDGHEEVVSEGRNCVACLMAEHYQERIDDLETDIKHMEETAEGYQERIDVLEADIAELQQPSKESVNG